MYNKIPKATVLRLSVYHRNLQGLLRKGTHIISSADLAHYTNVNPAQLRKDLSYFGKFGVRGVGYKVDQLAMRIQDILGLSKQWQMVLMGANQIGQALLQYSQFEKRGYNFVAAFDLDDINIGRSIGNIPVRPINTLEDIIRDNGIELGVIAVPSEKAQDAADMLVKAGIKGILNFSFSRITVPANIDIRNVDFTILLDTMTYTISQRNESKNYKISGTVSNFDIENKFNIPLTNMPLPCAV